MGIVKNGTYLFKNKYILYVYNFLINTLQDESHFLLVYYKYVFLQLLGQVF